MIRENDIRPDSLFTEQAKRFASDIRRLLTRKSAFVSVLCPACDSARSRPAFEKFELSYLHCEECATIYMSPRPTPAILEHYYSTSENYAYWNEYIFPASENARRERIVRPRARRLAEICARHGIPREILLEVGAGFGTFCDEIGKLGLFSRAIAVEPTPGLAASCRAKGLEVLEMPIEHVNLESERVNVVASFEVVEHLFSPQDFVRACARLLSPGGALVLTCPNVKGFDIATLGPLSDAIDVEHLNYFHPESLSLLVARCGLETIEVITPGELDAELVRKKALGGLFDLSRFPFLKRILLDEWDRLGDPFQRFLSDNGLSSHLWLVARKPLG